MKFEHQIFERTYHTLGKKDLLREKAGKQGLNMFIYNEKKSVCEKTIF